MNEKILEALTALANKLGTTAEYLWEVLVKQAVVAGVVSIALAVLFLVSVVLSFILVKKALRVTTEKLGAEDKVLIWALYTLLSCGPAGLAIGCIGKAVTCFVNPEYWALTKIISTLGQ